MRFEPVILVDVVDEPVTLAEIKSWLRIDQSYSSDDVNLLLVASSAREKLEKYLNLSFAPKTLQVQFEGDCFELPYGPQKEITSLLPVNSDDPQEIVPKVTGINFKKVHIGYSGNAEFFYPSNGAEPSIWHNNLGYCGLYNVEYTAGYGTDDLPDLPKALKHALLIQIDYDYKNQGEGISEFSELALSKANPYSKNLVI